MLNAQVKRLAASAAVLLGVTFAARAGDKDQYTLLNPLRIACCAT